MLLFKWVGMGEQMQIRVTLDDDLLATAREYTGLTRTSAVVNAALEALIQREASRRLAMLGGSDPHATLAPRRRSANGARKRTNSSPPPP
jgi:Arc/MetJ family transcription regulator